MWESADIGREECPVWTVDGVDRLWMRDEEVHVGADVVYGMRYVAATGDTGFLVDYGAEILFETSRYWIDRLDYHGSADRYSLKTVMGPDEFHVHVDEYFARSACVDLTDNQGNTAEGMHIASAGGTWQTVSAKSAQPVSAHA